MTYKPKSRLEAIGKDLSENMVAEAFYGEHPYCTKHHPNINPDCQVCYLSFTQPPEESTNE